MDESAEGNTLDTRQAHKDLNYTYSNPVFVGDGANDSGYRIRDAQGKTYIALVPKFQFGEDALRITRFKLDKARTLDECGLSAFAVRKVDDGVLKINGADKKTVVVEDGGEPVVKVEGEADRLEIVRQIWHATKTLHKNNVAVSDFKAEHWVYTRQKGRIRVRLIDYTKLEDYRKSPPSPEEDHRRYDIYGYNSLVHKLFPWFTPSSQESELSLAERQALVDADMARLREESKSFSSARKLFLRAKRR